MARAYLQRIGTAVPQHDIHQPFVEFASRMLADPHARTLFQRLAVKSEIQHRYSFLQADNSSSTGAPDAFAFYRAGHFPSTAQRMQLFEQCAPALARNALDNLALSAQERSRIRHLIVTCCTGFYAPGLDFDIVDYLGLDDATERTVVGFMGCYAAINALRLARHIVRSDPDADVLVVNLELCTLHLHETQDLGEILSFLLFSDGCAASLIGSEPKGFEMDSFLPLRIENSRDHITWRIGDQGFDMFLSGHVPSHILKSMRENKDALTDGAPVDLWAVHPGGRAILDAVQNGLALPADALLASRRVLSSFGNMSSATVMFVLQEMMREATPGQSGCAISFGPGMTAETMRFHAV